MKSAHMGLNPCFCCVYFFDLSVPCHHTSPFGDRGIFPIFAAHEAKVAQLVERNLAKVEVAGSNPVFRSAARMVKLVDTQDLKSCSR